jgi:hypothetical protein
MNSAWPDRGGQAEPAGHHTSRTSAADTEHDPDSDR